VLLLIVRSFCNGHLIEMACLFEMLVKAGGRQKKTIG
jgi:hypothetical protein